MIVFENGSWQKNSLFPDTNFLENEEREQPKWVVPDNSELADKIMRTPLWQATENENGELADIVPIALPEPKVSAEELKGQLEELDLQAIRPLRAIAAGTDTEEDRAVLAELEEQAEQIRAQIGELEADNG